MTWLWKENYRTAIWGLLDGIAYLFMMTGCYVIARAQFLGRYKYTRVSYLAYDHSPTTHSPAVPVRAPLTSTPTKTQQGNVK